MNNTCNNAYTCHRTAFAVVDHNLHFVEADEAFTALVGDGAVPLPGRSIAELVPELEAVLRQVVNTATPLTNLLLHATGGIAAPSYRVNLQPICTRRGTVLGVEIVVEVGGDGVEKHALADQNEYDQKEVGGNDVGKHTFSDKKYHDHHQAAADLQASEELFRVTFERAPVGIAHVSLNGHWLRVNSRYCAITGYTYAELLGGTFQEITYPDDLATDLACLERLLAGEIDFYELEKRYIRKDNSLVWVNLTVSLVRDRTGMPDYLIAVVEDISRRKQAEEELLFQAQLLDAVDQAVIATTWDGTIRFWNSFAECLYGWSAVEVIGQSVLEITPAEISQQQGQAIMARLQAGEKWSGEYLVRRRDGSIFPAFVSDVPLRDPDGSIIGIVGVSVDISERKRIEAEREELLAREQIARVEAEHTATRIARLQAITAALSEALTPAQVADVIVTQVQAALKTSSCGFRLVSADGQTLAVLRSSGMSQEVLAPFAQIAIDADLPIAFVARTGMPLYFASRAELAHDYPNLAAVLPLDYEASAVVPLHSAGRTIGTLTLVFSEVRSFDDEDRRFIRTLADLSAQAIERARHYIAAAEAVQVRDSFIAIAAHDLRSPLTALLGQAQLLERRAHTEHLSERTLRATNTITQQATRLNRLITAMLDLTSIQTGQLTIEPTPLDLAPLLTRIVSEIQPTLSNHSLVITSSEAAAWVWGDELRLEQVFQNLLGNAIKYSPQGGGIQVKLERRNGQISISVSDQGIGIPTAALPRLFERFYRAPNALEFGIKGMGIGLYAIREIVTLHGGTVTVTTAEGAGTTFTVRLPEMGESTI